jgi:hypothetical protein
VFYKVSKILLFLQEFGEDAATAINELLGLYGYVGGGGGGGGGVVGINNDESKRNTKFHHRESCKKIANISQKLLNSQRLQQQQQQQQSSSGRTTVLSSESESKINDYSSMSSDKDSTSRENSKSPPQTLRHNHDGKW